MLRRVSPVDEDQARPGAGTDGRAIDRPAGQIEGSDRAGSSERRRRQRPEVRVAPVLVTGGGEAPLGESGHGLAPQGGQPCGCAVRASLEALELRQVAIRAGTDGGHATAPTSSLIQS